MSIETKITGVLYKELFSQKRWHIINDKFRNFPDIMRNELKLPNVELIEPRKVEYELLVKTHTERFVKNLKKQWYSDGAFFTVGGCVQASNMIMANKLKNALAFGVAAGHHAEKNSAWGGTYASVSGPLVYSLQDKYPEVKIAILDTDSHHGNGTRNMVRGNENVLHVCFCSSNRARENNTKVCVDSGYSTGDKNYLSLVKDEFMSRIEKFRPDLILHLLGHDTAIGDYGDRGLSKQFFLDLVSLVKDGAERYCEGKYLINTHGGSSVDICEYIFPKIIRILAEN